MSFLFICDGFPRITAEQAKQLTKAAMQRVREPWSTGTAMLSISVFKSLSKKGLADSVAKHKGLPCAWATPRGCYIVGILLLAAKLAEKAANTCACPRCDAPRLEGILWCRMCLNATCSESQSDDRVHDYDEKLRKRAQEHEETKP